MALADDAGAAEHHPFVLCRAAGAGDAAVRVAELRAGLADHGRGAAARGLAQRYLRAHLRANFFDLLLCAGLLVAATLPASAASPPSLWIRLVVGFFTMARMFWAAHYVVTRGGTMYRLVAALLVLLLCGLGFWWLEPTTPTFADGLWLAFTTAATVGYGDSVPTTPASKIFAVLVVFLGVGAITLVAASIASAWIAGEERQIEREILDDLHRQLTAMRQEMAVLRASLPPQPQPQPPDDP